jgi:hypothetical protein
MAAWHQSSIQKCLIQVSCQTQMGSLRSEVSGRDGQTGFDFAFYVQVPRLNVSVFKTWSLTNLVKPSRPERPQ